MRIRSVLFSIFFLSVCVLTSQTAPNFTVTDSWGNTHNLYEDYLDQGTTVVLKIFFVSCPPCNAIAPHLEPLYQTWGGGNADVQFIELSVRQNDTNVLVNGYKSNHGTTYPAAGGQGGSVAAVQPYTSGMFGLYTGTPTFVVIAIDKTVNFDVSGFNIQGTINALDAAIAATGAQGMNTAVETPDKIYPVRLISTLVDQNLILTVGGEPGSIEVAVINMIGQTGIKNKYFARKGDSIEIDINDLPPGVWICRIENMSDRRVASYLFVKQ